MIVHPGLAKPEQNRLRITDDLALESVPVCDSKWPEWADCLYKDDHATNGTSADTRKRQVVATAQDFEIFFLIY
jgi:hypothetical protein